MRGLLILLAIIPLTGFTLETSPPPDLEEYRRSFLSNQPPDLAEYRRSFEPDQQPDTITVASAPQKKKKAFVPPGFELLLEPQTTQVDVYYGGAFLTSALATFTPNEITFANPAAVSAQIPDLLDQTAITTYLSGPLATNSGLACLTANQSNCGTLNPRSAEVIFDENRFRADLFIAPDLLSVRAAGIEPFLPPSDAGLSLLSAFSATVNGQEGRDKTYNIGNSTTLAYRESRLVAISNFNDNEDLAFDTLAVQREFAGQLVQGGYFRSNAGALVFVRESDFLGVSIGTSLDTRTDLDQSSGNELQLFLDSRSRVDIFKEGRLISTDIYSTGNQILDTSRLPGGAYDIVLRIRDSFGGVREETRFYVKSNRLPPLNETLYFIDVGEQVRKVEGKALPEENGQQLYRLGASRRISQNFGGEFGVIGDGDDHLLEFGLFRLGRNHDLRLNLAAGSGDSRAASLLSNFRLGQFTIRANLRETRTRENPLLGSEIRQASVSASRPMGRGSLHLSARYNERGNEADKNYGLRYELPNYTFHSQVISSNLQINRDNGDWQILLGARMAVNHGGWQTSLASQAFYEQQSERDESGVTSNLTSTWQDGDRYLSDVSLSLRAVDEQFDRTLESELDVASRLGRANIEAVYSDENERLSYGASFYTSLIANRDTVTFGGKRQARAAVVLDIAGEAQDAYFDVEVNKLVRDNATIGSKNLIPLAPFQTYDIGLIPRGKNLVEFNNARKTTTLYPGNVVTLRWEAIKILVAFGQLTDAAGKPIANALLEGVVGLATTDEFGIFQAEIKSDTKTIRARTRSGSCTAELPPLASDGLIATLGTLTCE